ncbi:hypothetical protein LELG_02262 [Lodderomyces elongisporus NRRL YB-4239]|uniref:Uncharacterized protein n=1 Tax=Lodderomyces elongisporus (strain ATCC 11503 / CBS 2605 / JCM 1781 / NBRC 1676 / NRRL YB-4239) TaxID=379508 RepID=A5DY25_LODEL|nr:hypothetical protein LELG_02262 [Lodderomyces elongisporus NRRL YB-4239]
MMCWKMCKILYFACLACCALLQFSMFCALWSAVFIIFRIISTFSTISTNCLVRLNTTIIDRSTMQLIQNLTHIILNSNKTYKVIEVIPNATDTKNDANSLNGFQLYEENCTLGIAVSKYQYLSIFKASHSYFYHHRNELLSIDKLSRDNLWEAYYMTLGYLITTNEHHTILKLHERIVDILQNHEQDLEIISTFLTSRLSRINKSSSLWAMLRRWVVKSLSITYGVRQNQAPIPMVDRKYILRALKSCEFHFANYYANNFLRWCILIGSVDGTFCNYWSEDLVQVCRSHHSDSSLWSTLNFLLKHNKTQTLTELLKPVMKELARESVCAHVTAAAVAAAAAAAGLCIGFGQSPKVQSTPNVISELSWLIQVDCKNLTPYIQLILALDSLDDLYKVKELDWNSINASLEIKSKIVETVDKRIKEFNCTDRD